MIEAQGQHPFLLSTASPNRSQRRLAAGIVAALMTVLSCLDGARLAM
jgi:hypothetical protein